MGLDPKEPYPKRPRLRYFDYIGTYAYFLTILTKNRDVYFKEADIVSHLIILLLETAKSERFDILAYCFMPDHLHILVMGRDGKSDLKRFMDLFKQKAGYWFKKINNKSLWHISYYDHVLRKEENIESVITYMLENPARKGLVQDFREYPFSWSFFQG
jgi:putative transposase